MYTTMQKSRGFTIVELLVVVIVIAALAAVSIATYSGIQQRTKNTSIINAVSTSLRMISLYVAQNGRYPFSYDGDNCVTADTGCSIGSTSQASFETNMATVGTFPRSIPSGSPGYGITMTWHHQATYNGTSAPARLTYFLFGTNQQCGVSGIETHTWPNYQSSATGYTLGDSNGQTMCWVNIPGPSA